MRVGWNKSCVSCAQSKQRCAGNAKWQKAPATRLGETLDPDVATNTREFWEELYATHAAQLNSSGQNVGQALETRLQGIQDALVAVVAGLKEIAEGVRMPRVPESRSSSSSPSPPPPGTRPFKPVHFTPFKPVHFAVEPMEVAGPSVVSPAAESAKMDVVKEGNVEGVREGS
jgi:hypothetical protein